MPATGFASAFSINSSNRVQYAPQFWCPSYNNQEPDYVDSSFAHGCFCGGTHLLPVTLRSSACSRLRFTHLRCWNRTAQVAGTERAAQSDAEFDQLHSRF